MTAADRYNFQDMTGLGLAGVLIVRGAPSIAGNAVWRVRFPACGHESNHQGIRIRKLAKLGRVVGCPTCRAAVRVQRRADWVAAERARNGNR